MSALKSSGLVVLGLAAALAWWSFTDGESQGARGIPETVWGGGGPALVVDVEVNAPTRVRAGFEKLDDDGGTLFELLEAVEIVGPGEHVWTIEVPERTGISFGAFVEEARPGAEVTIRVTIDGRVVYEESDTLREELTRGYAFGVSCDLEVP